MIFFITGATAGFGSAMSERFVKSGHKVIGTGRRIERLKSLREKLGPSFLPLELDVTQKASVTEVINSLPKDFSAIDVLVNNTGLALGMDLAQDADLTDWETMVSTNINGVLYCTHALLPGMLERKKGHIVNLGSVAGEFPYAKGNVYGASKAFIHQFSLNLKADLVGTPIRVSCVEPGMCDGSEFSEVRFKGNTEKAKSVYAGVKPISAEDIAETVEWIISRPAHMNINTISLMPVQQAFAGFSVDREMTWLK